MTLAARDLDGAELNLPCKYSIRDALYWSRDEVCIYTGMFSRSFGAGWKSRIG
jgi:hypothetical protein